MSAQETTQTTKEGGGEGGGGGGGGGGEPRGPGACTVQGCTCPAFVGNQSYCNRNGCGHAFSQHDNR
uniref:Zinc-binding peptide 1 n=1 Tax=Russula ochroleuca TaxID=152965 RepID=A0A482LWG6_9AGAM|nr:zinc-binding peptide 1 [Russula ochroleuca]